MRISKTTSPRLTVMLGYVHKIKTVIMKVITTLIRNFRHTKNLRNILFYTTILFLLVYYEPFDRWVCSSDELTNFNKKTKLFCINWLSSIETSIHEFEKDENEYPEINIQRTCSNPTDVGRSRSAHFLWTTIGKVRKSTLD